MIIGGLPEVVANYAQYHDMVRLSDVFNALLSGYRDDVEKYADNRKEQDSIRYILNYGWTSAGHRIQFAKFTNSSFKSADVSNAFRTLEKTLLLELVYPLTSTSFPILPDLKKSPKLLWLDTGLVNYVAGMQEELLFTTDSDSCGTAILQNISWRKSCWVPPPPLARSACSGCAMRATRRLRSTL